MSDVTVAFDRSRLNYIKVVDIGDDIRLFYMWYETSREVLFLLNILQFLNVGLKNGLYGVHKVLVYVGGMKMDRVKLFVNRVEGRINHIFEFDVGKGPLCIIVHRLTD